VLLSSIELVEKCAHTPTRQTWMPGSAGGLAVDDFAIADFDQDDHAGSIVRRALDAVEAFFVEGHGHRLVGAPRNGSAPSGNMLEIVSALWLGFVGRKVTVSSGWSSMKAGSNTLAPSAPRLSISTS
jgi:hypothetical protein